MTCAAGSTRRTFREPSDRVRHGHSPRRVGPRTPQREVSVQPTVRILTTKLHRGHF